MKKKQHNNMITVTKTFFPPIEEYQAQLQRVWDNQWLTNRGTLVTELEGKLTYLDDVSDNRFVLHTFKNEDQLNPMVDIKNSL